MRFPKGIALAVVLLLCAACAAPVAEESATSPEAASTAAPSSGDLARVRAVGERLAAAVNSGDVEAIVGLHASDATVLAPGHPAVTSGS